MIELLLKELIEVNSLRWFRRLFCSNKELAEVKARKKIRKILKSSDLGDIGLDSLGLKHMEMCMMEKLDKISTRNLACTSTFGHFIGEMRIVPMKYKIDTKQYDYMFAGHPLICEIVDLMLHCTIVGKETWIERVNRVVHYGDKKMRQILKTIWYAENLGNLCPPDDEILQQFSRVFPAMYQIMSNLELYYLFGVKESRDRIQRLTFLPSFARNFFEVVFKDYKDTYYRNPGNALLVAEALDRPGQDANKLDLHNWLYDAEVKLKDEVKKFHLVEGCEELRTNLSDSITFITTIRRHLRNHAFRSNVFKRQRIFHWV